jgi:DUF2075 family protein
MLVYTGTKKSFSNDIRDGNIARIIDSKLKEFGINQGGLSQFTSWQNSLPQMFFVLDDKEIEEDVEVSIEYQIPLTSRRVDFLIAGSDDQNKDHVMIIELKQWQKAKKLSRENLVETFTGGSNRVVVHPSQQAYSYAKLIENFNQSIYEENINLVPCAYLHNYEETYRDQLFGPEYQEVINEAPLFLSEDRPKLREFIKKHTKKKATKDIFKVIENGKLKPSKALQDAVGEVMNGNHEFVLIMEQQVAYATVLKLVQSTINKNEKHTIIVKGGPGTGKSVVAVNLLSKLIQSGYSANYITKNSAPRAAFSKKLIKGKYKLQYLRGLFRGSGSYYEVNPNTFDCLITDEAHRLKLKSGYNSLYGENQVKEIINAARISVFFIDEDQIVTTKDIGSVQEIKRWAKELNSKIHESEELTLVSQFRCNGSDGYLAFLDNILGIRSTANYELDFDYDVKVFEDPNEMYAALKQKNINNKSRMIAGYTYEWFSDKDKTQFDIYLPNGFKKQWNFDTEGFAIDPNSFEQVGCIHSTQGLEFDYVGIIIGMDLRYENGSVITDRSKTAKSDNSSGVRTTKNIELADRIIRNTYKTLLSRGQKGCYIYCEDKNLSDFLKIKLNSQTHR